MNGSLAKMKRGLFLRMVSWAMIVTVTAAAIIFSTPLPAFAISPPFPSPLYLRITPSTIIGATSWQLSDTAGTAENNVTRTASVVGTEKQWWPGNATGSSTITNGYGWIFEQPLNGQYDAGTWTFQVRLRTNSGSATGTVKAYVFRYASGTYTPLFTATSGTLSVTTTITNYSFSAAPGVQDMQGEYLYVHYTWLAASGTASIRFIVDTSDIFITPPGSAVPTLGTFLTLAAVTFFVVFLIRRRILYVRRAEA